MSEWALYVNGVEWVDRGPDGDRARQGAKAIGVLARSALPDGESWIKPSVKTYRAPRA